ncbi:hypothetical protein E4U42_002809 [Claviceps africana]|uniref:Glucan 1, 4-alpha-glucosidase n=1 Tax=Claviceps africana TaxID=83212 RepID=A0A8K0J7U0_9HYPO|nr:hypothetical protein E4U42_002809 [Claviceps africana]
MEDPWDSSPWIHDPAARAATESVTDGIHVADLSASPWGRTGHEGDVWGGWADVSPAGGKADGMASVSCWELRGEVTAAAMAALPDPWTGEEMLMRGTGEDGDADSGIRGGGEERTAGGGRGGVVALPGGCEDRTEGRSSAEWERPARAEGYGPVSKVQELVDMYDGMARTRAPDLQLRLEEMPLGEDAMAARTPDVEVSLKETPSGGDTMPERTPDLQLPLEETLLGGNTLAAKTPDLRLSLEETPWGVDTMATSAPDLQLSLKETPSGGDTMAAAAAAAVVVDGGDGEQGSATHPDGLDPATENPGVASEEEEEPSPAESSAAAAPDNETCITCSTTTTTTATKAPLPTALPYPIDLCNLDDLFPGTQASLSTAIAPARLPDTVIDDSFTSVAQRKAWYRVSRPGSLRKHNSGDDDGYVRVSWHTSHVRKHVLAIIRRWLEEDSLGSRRLGWRPGHHAGATMFNWDSDGPGVQIGELLSRKHGARAGHARQASAAVPGTVVSPLAMSFGWSASVPASPVDTRGFLATSERRARPSPLTQTRGPGPAPNAPEHLPTAQPDTPPEESRPVPEPAPSPEAGNDDNNDDDDDDWGEMVSSPTVDTLPPLSTTGTHATPAETMRVDSPSPAPVGNPPTGPASPSAPTRPDCAAPSVQNLSALVSNPWHDAPDPEVSTTREDPALTIPNGVVGSPTTDAAEKADARARAAPDDTPVPESPSLKKKHALPARVAPHVAPPPPVAAVRSVRPVEQDLDDMVVYLLRDLPDLSYMLR